MGLFDSLENIGEIGLNIVKGPIAIGRDLIGIVTDEKQEDLLPRTGKLIDNTGNRIEELVKPNPLKNKK